MKRGDRFVRAVQGGSGAGWSGAELSGAGRLSFWFTAAETDSNSCFMSLGSPSLQNKRESR